MNWEKLARYCQNTYTTTVDMYEEFFICPECDEPIYAEDWNDSDFTLGKKYHGKLYCPICENLLMESNA